MTRRGATVGAHAEQGTCAPTHMPRTYSDDRWDRDVGAANACVSGACFKLVARCVVVGADLGPQRG